MRAKNWRMHHLLINIQVCGPGLWIVKSHIDTIYQCYASHFRRLHNYYFKCLTQKLVVEPCLVSNCHFSCLIHPCWDYRHMPSYPTSWMNVKGTCQENIVEKPGLSIFGNFDSIKKEKGQWCLLSQGCSSQVPVKHKCVLGDASVNVSSFQGGSSDPRRRHFHDYFITKEVYGSQITFTYICPKESHHNTELWKD